MAENQKQYDRKIIGVDFDDTLFLHSYPANDSEPNWAVINYIRHQKSEGAYIILVTCRHRAEDLKFAIEACRRVGIEFDAVNDNLPFMKEKFGDCRKVYCNEYIDDKNITIQQIENAVPEEKRRPVYVVIGYDDKFAMLVRKLKWLDGIAVVRSTIDECVTAISDMVDNGIDINGISIDASEWNPEGLRRFEDFLSKRTMVDHLDIRSKH